MKAFILTALTASLLSGTALSASDLYLNNETGTSSYQLAPLNSQNLIKPNARTIRTLNDSLLKAVRNGEATYVNN